MEIGVSEVKLYLWKLPGVPPDGSTTKLFMEAELHVTVYEITFLPLQHLGVYIFHLST